MGRMTDRTSRAWVVLLAVALGVAAACDCSDDGEGDGSDGGGPGTDGTTPGADGTTPGADGTTPGADGTVPGTDGAPTGDGSTPGPCVPITCDGHGPFQCANCIDDDGDGLIDAADGNCLGPCDNNESGFRLNIPGSDTPACSRDCYYDGDQGSGNDGCSWDSRCDPLSPDSRPACAAPPPGEPTPPSARCDDELTAMCLEICPPLVPNGCDCFGCCNITESEDDPDNWVFIGTLGSDGMGSCTLERALAMDYASCRPCTPHGDCANDCAHCELCLGRTTIPPDCFEPTDAGVPPGTDAGPRPDGGTPSGRCPGGEQPCGLPGDPACDAGYYCLTGCCIFFG